MATKSTTHNLKNMNTQKDMSEKELLKKIN